MIISDLTKEDILNALKYIDDNEVPKENQSKKYDLIEDGKRYPPKYVVAVARHLNDGSEIDPSKFGPQQALLLLEKHGFYIKNNQEQKPETKEEDNDNKIYKEPVEYQNPLTRELLKSKNIIFHGAPGTGKTYLAKQIATDIVSNGQFQDYTQLTNEQKKQIEFVQFHPSYDYTDFVEGLRPKISSDKIMEFELQDGILKKFVERAKANLIAWPKY